MAKIGGFTLSLDCEGLWGMADQPDMIKNAKINQKTLADAYDFVCNILDRENIHCTAAFVTGFAVGRSAVMAALPILHELRKFVPGWYTTILEVFENDKYDGWDGSDFFQKMSNDGHEMGWHGASHLSLENSTPIEAIKLEMELTAILLSQLSSKPSSIVFPRNKIGNLQTLQKAGFHCYRNQRGTGRLSKIGSLAREFHIFDRNVEELPFTDNYWNVSPAGFFLNWPNGFRSLVPSSVTVTRWRTLLRSAVQTGGYVHMWFHPHNLITAPIMRDIFDRIMIDVGKYVRNGDLKALTMSQAANYFTSRG